MTMEGDGDDAQPDVIKSIMDECITILANDPDEFTHLEGTEKTLLEWKDLLKERENSIKESIKALSSDCDEERQKLQSEVSASGEASVQELTNQLAHAHQRLQQVAAQVKECKQHQMKTEEKKKQLASQRNQVKSHQSQELPALRHEANLYHHVSKIRWQYDSSPEEIKGYVCNKDKVRTFSLNSTQNSKSFIVSYLWDMMEPDW